MATGRRKKNAKAAQGVALVGQCVDVMYERAMNKPGPGVWRIFGTNGVGQGKFAGRAVIPNPRTDSGCYFVFDGATDRCPFKILGDGTPHFQFTISGAVLTSAIKGMRKWAWERGGKSTWELTLEDAVIASDGTVSFVQKYGVIEDETVGAYIHNSGGRVG